MNCSTTPPTALRLQPPGDVAPEALPAVVQRRLREGSRHPYLRGGAEFARVQERDDEDQRGGEQPVAHGLHDGAAVAVHGVTPPAASRVVRCRSCHGVAGGPT